MDGGDNDAMILPVPPEPFALILGKDGYGPDEGVEAVLRRMGLRPEPIGDGAAATDGRIGAPAFRLHFGDVSVLAGPAADIALDLADPALPTTSLLSASLPSDWRAREACWLFIPEREDPGERPISPERPRRMREFFKLMVLLIDLFDASHIFWSPALLWSDAAQFRASIAEMLTSGMPPVFHLVAFRRREDAAGASLGTRGLDLFAGQELDARIPPGWTVAETVRRLSRLALDMMLNGPVCEARTLRGLEAGEWIDLSPQPVSRGQRSKVVVEFDRAMG